MANFIQTNQKVENQINITNKEALKQLTDFQLEMMIFGLLHKRVSYGYIYKGVRLMYVDGSYGRTHIESGNLQKLGKDDKLEVVFELLEEK